MENSPESRGIDSLPVATVTQPTIDFQIDIVFHGMRRAVAENGIECLCMGAAEIAAIFFGLLIGLPAAMVSGSGSPA
jgi:hypothetical protein